MKNNNHIILISFDAFSIDNWEKACTLPNIKWLLENGSYTNKLNSVYPTLTYVVHTTMVTGVYPNRHNIYHNSPFQPFVKENNQEWFWYKEALTQQTIYEVAKEKGLKTASIMWPVTGGAKFNYNLPEVRAINGENQAFKILKNGTPFYIIDMELKFGKDRESYTQPHLDNFSTNCTCEVIKSKKPNLTMVHLIALDDAKHKYGTKSEKIDEALRLVDNNIGKIIESTKENGLIDNTTFIVVGDHGQFDVHKKIRLNKLLEEKGLISVKNQSYRAYIQGNGGSAYLYIKEGDFEAEKIAIDLLREATIMDIYGIETVYSTYDLEYLNVYKGAAYMIEAKKGYSFLEDLDGEIIVDLDKENKVYATHGYSPLKDDYTCNLIFSGKNIKKGVNLQGAEMVDIAPTIAKLLDVDFPYSDGRVLYEILK
ncbi:MAG: alkaline phosphatase family protein [Lachnospirales bacterium]